MIRPTLTRALAEGELLTEENFISRSGLTAAALAAALSEQRLICIEFEGVRAYPAFFVDPTLPREVLGDVAQLLGSTSPGGKWLFFTQLNAFLSASLDTHRTPLQALRDGDIEKVRRAAESAR